MNIQLLDLAAQRARLGTRLDAAIQRVLEHGQFILGPDVANLEEELAAFCGAAHCVSCGNGTDALTLILMAEGIGPGDAVIVPAFTFVATAEAPVLAGATPVFADVDPHTFNIDVDSARAATDCALQQGLRPRAIIAVDLFGRTADYPRLAQLARDKQLTLLADGAQSFGATLDGQHVGTLADHTSTSFFPAKPLGGYGDGGAIFTSDDGIAEKVRSLRAHGRGSHKYAHERVGMNSRLDTLHAAVLREKLGIFPEELQRRRTIACYYHEHLASFHDKPMPDDKLSSAWAQYTLRSTHREAIIAHCDRHGVPTAIYYPAPLHLQPAYRGFPVVAGGLPVAEQLCAEVFSVPMHPYLQADEIEHIVRTLNSAAPK